MAPMRGWAGGDGGGAGGQREEMKAEVAMSGGQQAVRGGRGKGER